MKTLQKAHALCPHCLKTLNAEIYSDESNKVWMKRTCPEHGEVTSYVWPDADHYMWLNSLHMDCTAPKVTDAPVVDACCKSCGLCSRHTRRGTLVEIEVTRRCNMKCPVCFMSADFPSDGISFEEIEGLISTLATKVGSETGLQITGGEPTVRKDLPQIVAMARRYGFRGIEVNTNGLVIGKDIDYLRQLVDAGITGVYIAFDGVDENPYKIIRGSAASFSAKLAAVENCRKVGIQVVVCMTIVSGVNDDQVGKVIQFALDNADVVRGVALQPAFNSGRFEPDRIAPYTAGDTIFSLEEQTGGLIKASDIWPLGCSHPLCDTGTFLVPTKDGGWECATRGLTQEKYIEYFDPTSPQGSAFSDVLYHCGVKDWDRGMSIIIMNYMDAMSTTVERMRECSMTVAMKDGRVIPFCSYQMTNSCGDRIYQMWGTGASE